jgi:hypothetical protein
MNKKLREKGIKKAFDEFFTPQANEHFEEMDCSTGTCVIKKDKSLIERINKKIILEDGRQLLI